MEDFKFLSKYEPYSFYDNLPKNISVELLEKMVDCYIVTNYPNIDNQSYNELCELKLECATNRIKEIKLKY